MRIEQIKELYEAEPFKKFTIHLADGRELEVAHPENIAFSQSGRSIAVFEGKRHHLIDVMLVTDLEKEAE